MSKKFGIVTCGGDCPGLNAVIRAVVKTAIGKYGYDVYAFLDGYSGLVKGGEKIRKMDTKMVSGILDRGGTILGTSRENPFKDNGGQLALQNYRDMGLDCLIAIGGDGTLRGAYEFSLMGMNVIGVPKTIDNDLEATDTTFGFMTAVDIATEAIDRLHSTAESHHRVMFLEVMGRNAGWIALEAGIAGGADVILIPEIPYDIQKVAEKIQKRKNEGKNFSIVVVAEGAIAQGTTEIPKKIKPGEISNVIADQLDDLIGLECKVTVLGHIQRGGTPSPYDRILSTRYGVAAAEFAHEGKYGVMVSLQGNNITSVPLEKAVGRQKLVPPQGELVQIAKSVGVGFGD